jgi:hypothetical protein
MSSIQQAGPRQQRIVIHHISDVHFRQRPGNNRELRAGQDPLVKYRGYLEELPPDRRPDVIAITGDLTATGNQHDLVTIATILRNSFPKWDAELAQHIFVVPGPRDVSWDGTGTPGLAAFYEAFHDFALPSRTHGLPDHGVTPTAALNWAVYPLDTCYTLDEFRAELKDEFHQHANEYHEFVTHYRQATTEPVGWLGLGRRRTVLTRAELRARYLRVTEGNPLTLLDAGRVEPMDLKAFIDWTTASANSPRAANGPSEPLKILISHHPLAIQPESESGTAPLVQQRFQHVMNLARGAGFHLALHGHIHQPRVLSDLSILEGADYQHPLREIGAGSLGDDGKFNEITAVYSEETGQQHWQVEIRAVNVLSAQPDKATSLVLLNPTKTIAEEKEVLKREAGTRRDFDTRVRSLMRQYSEIVFRTQAEDKADRSKGDPLPQAAMQAVESIIRDVVFKDSYVRVRLLIKDKGSNPLVPRLKALYLAPRLNEGPGGLTYPASVAAWSLVLGRTLHYPRVTREALTPEDYDWLKRSGKVPELLGILEALQGHMGGRSWPASEEARRYEVLHTKLAVLRDADATDLTGADFYQESPRDGSAPGYPYFVCIPFPLRERGGGYPPELLEAAVLDIGVRILERTGDTYEPANDPAVQIFTSERLRMLEFLAELVGVILTTSSALGKPKGMWDDRFRV